MDSYIYLWIIYSISGILIAQFFNKILTPKRDKTFTFLSISFIVSISSIPLMNIWDNILIKTPLAAFTILLLVLILFKDSFFKKLTVLVISFLSLFTIDFFGFILFKFFDADYLSNITRPSGISYVAMNYTLLFLFYDYIAEFLNKRWKRTLDYIDTETTRFIFLILLMSLIMMLMVSDLDDLSMSLIFMLAIYFCLICIFAIWLSYKSKGNAKKEMKYIFAKTQLDLQKQNYIEMKKQYGEVRKLKHDLTNHITVLSGLLEQKQYDELGDYLHTLSKTRGIKNDVTFCNRVAVDVVLANEYRLAKDNNIDINISVSKINDLDVSDFDLCAIFYNLLQNGIEANYNVDGEKFIDIEGHKNANYFVITMKNSGIETDNILKSSKDEKWHGLGLHIINEIAEKYNGYSLVKYEDKQFVSIVALMLRE